MTRDEATTILDNISMNEAIPAALAIQVLRQWKAAGINPEAVIEILGHLRPAEVMEVAAYAERKQARRNRPR
jgi:hypothetical protein